MIDDRSAAAPSRDWAAIGWHGADPEDADVVAKREYLAAHAGLAGLEILDPAEIGVIMGGGSP